MTTRGRKRWPSLGSMFVTAAVMLPAVVLTPSCDWLGDSKSNADKVGSWSGEVHDDNLFELGPGLAADEGGLTNILGDGALANGPDWADLFDANGNKIGTFEGAFIADDLSTSSAVDATVFAGSTSDKNSFLVADWDWGSGNVPAKDDISTAYAYATKNGLGQLIIYFGAERLAPNGDSHIDVELFQNEIGLDKVPPCGNDGTAGVDDSKPCEFTGEKKAGDIIVSMDFTQGGDLGTVTVRKRNATNTGYDLLETLTGEGCTGDDFICAFNNGGAINGGPWPNFDSHAKTITNLPQNAFTEWGVNVSALALTTPCFPTIQVKTRSAQSFTAELKDFAQREFQQCQSSGVTEIHSGASVGGNHIATDIQGGSVNVGQPIHDKAIITGTGSLDTPTGTITFKRFANATCSGAPVDTSAPVALTAVTPATTPPTSVAESPTFTPTVPGPISYLASYSGDSKYPVADSPCEPLTVNKVNSSTITDVLLEGTTTSVLNKAVTAGTSVKDKAIVTGDSSIGAPTGTVTFFRYANADCTGTATQLGDPVALTAVSSNTSTALSAAFVTLDDTFVGFKATYSGDSNYNPSTSTACEPICSFTFLLQPAP